MVLSPIFFSAVNTTNFQSCADDYRFGFNGQEKDNEIAGIGNSNTAQFWQYDTRLGRRWNIDPVDQIGVSNYAVMRDNPILLADPNGDYSKLGAKVRNFFHGGRGTSYTASTGEWGYEKGVKGGVAYRDGLSSAEANKRVDKYKETHFYSKTTESWVGKSSTGSVAFPKLGQC